MRSSSTGAATVEAVIVDFDDTLCPSEAACFELENAVLAELSRPPMSRAVHRATWGQPLFEAIVERSPGVDVEQFRLAYQTVIAQFVHQNLMDVIPEVNLAALDLLVASDRQVMILTSRTRHEVTHLMAPDHLLATRVERFYHRDSTHHHKPDPRVFDRLLDECGLTPERCVYVGDALVDAEAANGAGLHFIACLESGLRSRSEFAATNVAAFLQTFADLPAAVESLARVT